MRKNAQDKFAVLTQDRDRWRGRFDHVVASLAPVLDSIGEEAEPPEGYIRVEERFITRCSKVWGDLKRFTREGCEFVAQQVLALTRSHYPFISMQRLESGFAAEVQDDA